MNNSLKIENHQNCKRVNEKKSATKLCWSANTKESNIIKEKKDSSQLVRKIVYRSS